MSHNLPSILKGLNSLMMNKLEVSNTKVELPKNIRENNVREWETLGEALPESRSRAYKFLYYMLQPPDGEFLKLVKSKEFYESLNLIIPYSGDLSTGLERIKRYVERANMISPDRLLERLSYTYTRVFRGIKPGYSPPPPYESVYRGGAPWIIEAEIASIYARYGLKPKLREPPDSLVVELAFMSYLCAEEAAARKSGDMKRVLSIIEAQINFLKEHILTWVPEFCSIAMEYCKKIGEDAELYLGILELMSRFLEHDMLILESLKNIEAGYHEDS